MAQLPMTRRIFRDPFYRGGGGHFAALGLRMSWTELHQIWNEHRILTDALQKCFRFFMLLLFETTVTQRRLWSKIEPNLGDFHTLKL